jgi:hypothetical protein
MLDAVLESALDSLPDLAIPGRFGLWLARFPIEQAGNDQRVAEFESYLSEITMALHAFVQAAETLPVSLRDVLDDAGLGPRGFAALVDDPRLSTTPRAPRRHELAHFLDRLRAKANAAIQTLDQQTERGYR